MTGKSFQLIKRLLLTVFLILLCLVCYRIEAGGKKFDREFDEGSRVEIGPLDGETGQRLLKLCKVWGFAKYYHPKVNGGAYNWDYELFRVIGPVLEAENEEEADEVLYRWLDGLGKVKEGKKSPCGETVLEARTDWITSPDYLSAHLSGLLCRISRAYDPRRERAYVSYRYNMVPSFDEEEYPDMDYADQGFRLLGLFRYWNIIEYFYPYRDIIDEDWDSVFLEYLPRFAQGADELSYKLACAELTSRIHDSHSYAFDDAMVLMGGEKAAPFTFTHTGGEIVVDSIGEDYPEGIPTVLPGDIVKMADGVDIWEVAKEREKKKARSRDTVVLNDLTQDLFRGYQDQMRLTVKRDGEELEIVVPCIVRSKQPDTEKPANVSHRLMNGDIGYIDPGALKKGEILDIMEEFKDTRGIIVDLRNYPSDFIMYTLGEIIVPERKPFAVISKPNPEAPGEFVRNGAMYVGAAKPEECYKGRVAILMNEQTQSQAEFTIMALRQAPNAVVIGSPSIGADGDVAYMTFPGCVRTSMSSLGVYGPDMSQTQRIGLKPDIFFEPTIQGIREGRDELIEKAVEVISGD